jgi:hypothetical protein
MGGQLAVTVADKPDFLYLGVDITQREITRGFGDVDVVFLVHFRLLRRTGCDFFSAS